MNNYIGIKLIKAEPEDKIIEGKSFLGYKVIYPDGFISWSPRATFDSSHLQIDPNPRLKTGISITQNMVDKFIMETHVSTIGDKTTLVRVVLVNGFEIIESSTSVDVENYSRQIGCEICMEKIKDKIWMLLGFLLQTAVGGVE